MPEPAWRAYYCPGFHIFTRQCWRFVGFSWHAAKVTLGRRRGAVELLRQAFYNRHDHEFGGAFYWLVMQNVWALMALGARILRWHIYALAGGEDRYWVGALYMVARRRRERSDA